MDSKVCFETFLFTLWICLWILVQMVYLMDLLMDSGKTGLPYGFEIWIQTAQTRQFSSLAPSALAECLQFVGGGSARETNPL